MPSVVDAPDPAAQAARISSRVQPGRRLVEHQQARLAHHARGRSRGCAAGRRSGCGPGDRACVELEVSRRPARRARGCRRISPRACGVRNRSCSMPGARELAAPTMMFSSTVMLLEDLRRLERADHAGAAAILDRLPRSSGRAAIDGSLPVCSGQIAADDVEQRGLARAVRADQPDEAAARERRR